MVGPPFRKRSISAGRTDRLHMTRIGLAERLPAQARRDVGHLPFLQQTDQLGLGNLTERAATGNLEGICLDRPVAGNAPPAVAEAPTGAPVAGAKLPDNLFLPSSSSIPAVSIMNTEPSSPPETTTSGESTRSTARRKPLQAQARPPAKNPSAGPPAPLQLAPSDQ